MNEAHILPPFKASYPSVYQYESFRDYLSGLYLERRKNNPQYSLRALARSLKLHHTTLSLVLRGKRKISLDRAQTMADLLRLEPKEKAYFLDLLEVDAAKIQPTRGLLQNKLNARLERLKTVMLKKTQFSCIQNWYYMPLLQMVKFSEDFAFSIANASLQLGVSESSIKDALQKFERLGLIRKENDAWKRTQERVLVSSDAREAMLQHYHRMMLKKAAENIGYGSPEEKFTGTETFALDKSQMADVKQVLENAFDEIISISNRAGKKDSVYHLNVSMFNLLTHPNPQEQK